MSISVLLGDEAVALGAMHSGLSGAQDASLLERHIATRFASKRPRVVEQNLEASRAGREAAAA